MKDQKVTKVPSDQPTALIAPSDYEHIFKGDWTKKKQQQKNEIKDKLKMLSDQPTALIAPSDYEHIFQASPIEKKIPKLEKAQKIPSDAPTALIAPSDYEHIFTARVKTNAKRQKAMEIKKESKPKLREYITKKTPLKEPLPIYQPKGNEKMKPKESLPKLLRKVSNKNLKEKSNSEREVLPNSIENLIENFIAKQLKQYTISK